MPEEIALLPCYTQEKTWQETKSYKRSFKEKVGKQYGDRQCANEQCGACPGAFQSRMRIRGVARHLPGTPNEMPPTDGAKPFLAQGCQQVNNELILAIDGIFHLFFVADVSRETSVTI